MKNAFRVCRSAFRVFGFWLVPSHLLDLKQTQSRLIFDCYRPAIVLFSKRKADTLSAAYHQKIDLQGLYESYRMTPRQWVCSDP
jgi:hypothetical protein